MSDSDLLRLSKLMADRGICSRREADECIQKGWVKVNGEVMNQLGQKVTPDVEISLNEKAYEWLKAKLSVIINKPVGYVSGQAEENYTPASALLTSEKHLRAPGDPPPPSRLQMMSLAPAGRLDIDSWGLLILTQDGRLARAIISPVSTLEKEYLVWVQGEVTESTLRKLRHGLELDGKPLKPAQVTEVEPGKLQFILREGKKRQIRRMCDLVGLEVKGLLRVRIGPLTLGNLKPGEWRYLSRNEVFGLLKGVNEKASAFKKERPKGVHKAVRRFSDKKRG